MESLTDIIDCARCPDPISRMGSLFATCRGPCGKSYHSSCIGLLRNQVTALSENVFWLCEQCATAFDQWKTAFQPESAISSPSAIDVEIVELKDHVAGILDRLALITTKLSTFTTSVSSSPVASSTLCSGTKDDNSSKERLCITDPSRIETVNSSDEFSLLLTNVNNAVSVEEIRAVVSRCLGAPSIECNNIMKLVPNWVDCRTLDYVSFKIDLNEKMEMSCTHRFNMAPWGEIS